MADVKCPKESLEARAELCHASWGSAVVELLLDRRFERRSWTPAGKATGEEVRVGCKLHGMGVGELAVVNGEGYYLATWLLPIDLANSCIADPLRGWSGWLPDNLPGMTRPVLRRVAVSAPPRMAAGNNRRIGTATNDSYLRLTRQSNDLR